MVDRKRRISIEEEEIANHKAPVVSREDFNIKEKFFVNGDLGGVEGDL